MGSVASLAEAWAHSAVSRILSLMIHDQQQDPHADSDNDFHTSCSARAAPDDKLRKQAFAPGKGR